MAQGNAVMRAKRTTGPTPNAVLIARCREERCSACKQRAPLRSLTRSNGSIVRVCGPCIAPHDNAASLYPDPKDWKWGR